MSVGLTSRQKTQKITFVRHEIEIRGSPLKYDSLIFNIHVYSKVDAAFILNFKTKTL